MKVSGNSCKTNALITKKTKEIINPMSNGEKNSTIRSVYCARAETRQMMKDLEKYFESKIEIPLIRHGKRQRLETLINEEALLLAKHLRGGMKEWTPRISFHIVY